MLRGEPIWQTSSTGPMSMPSSRDAVATSALSSPARRRRSTRARRSFERLPWWAATTSSPSRSPSWWARRSASRRVLTNTSVVWCSRTSSAIWSSTSSICSAEVTASSSPSGSSSCEIQVALVAGVDDRGQRTVADEQPRDRLDRSLGGGQPDPRRALVAQRLEPLEREREVRAPLVPGDGVDLVHDHRLGGPQQLAAALAGDEEEERLRGRDHEARRVAQHRGALRGGGVAGADRDPDVRGREPELDRDLGDLRQRALEVLGDVDRERLQRRHVDDPGDVGDRLARVVGPVEPVDADEEPGEGLARSGGGRDQRVDARGDVDPALGLRAGRAVREPAPEPLRDRRMEGAVGLRSGPRDAQGHLAAGHESSHASHPRAGVGQQPRRPRSARGRGGLGPGRDGPGPGLGGLVVGQRLAAEELDEREDEQGDQSRCRR